MYLDVVSLFVQQDLMNKQHQEEVEHLRKQLDLATKEKLRLEVASSSSINIVISVPISITFAFIKALSLIL